jgi:hypothetical protein
MNEYVNAYLKSYLIISCHLIYFYYIRLKWTLEKCVYVRYLYVDLYRSRFLLQNITDSFTNLHLIAHLLSKVGDYFKPPVTGGIISIGLMHLIFSSNLNQPISVGALPDGLIQLRFGIIFNQSFECRCDACSSNTSNI